MIKNGKLRLTIISLCVSVFVVLVGWGSSFVTLKVNRGQAEQKVTDTIENHTAKILQNQYEIKETKKTVDSNTEENKRLDKEQSLLKKDVEYIKSDVSEIKGDVKLILEKVK